MFLPQAIFTLQVQTKIILITEVHVFLTVRTILGSIIHFGGRINILHILNRNLFNEK